VRSSISPSADFRNGIIHWTDTSGNAQISCIQNASQTLDSRCPGGQRISSNCGASANLSCDPRGLGMSPTVAALLNLIKPLPNDSSHADSVGCTTSLNCQNISGYLFNTPAPLQDDAFNVRLDHNLTQNLHFFGRYAWFREISFPSGNPAQVDLTKPGNPILDSQGIRGDDAVAGFDWTIRSNLINSFSFGWVRQRVDFNTFNEGAIANALKLPGAQDASGNYVSFEDGYAQPPNEIELFAQPILAPAANGVQHGKNIQFTDCLASAGTGEGVLPLR
jgi:hypothetical protein